jgi:hypothetical protein
MDRVTGGPNLVPAIDAQTTAREEPNVPIFPQDKVPPEFNAKLGELLERGGKGR